MNKQDMKKIAVVMGSQSDWNTIKYACISLKEFDIPYQTFIISAHRTPERLSKFSKNAYKKFSIIIAGAGGSAHLPGMLASESTVPVLGVPVETTSLKGLDSLLSIVQMPKGVPVACFSIGISGAINAALFAVSMLSQYDDKLLERWKKYRMNQTKSVKKLPNELL